MRANIFRSTDRITSAASPSTPQRQLSRLRRAPRFMSIMSRPRPSSVTPFGLPGYFVLWVAIASSFPKVGDNQNGDVQLGRYQLQCFDGLVIRHVNIFLAAGSVTEGSENIYDNKAWCFL